MYWQQSFPTFRNFLKNSFSLNLFSIPFRKSSNMIRLCSISFLFSTELLYLFPGNSGRTLSGLLTRRSLKKLRNSLNDRYTVLFLPSKIQLIWQIIVLFSYFWDSLNVQISILLILSSISKNFDLPSKPSVILLAKFSR